MEMGWNPNGDQVLPACPRCGSSITKFCYYNNYSLTQPRYFCKSCRRYWTKGGSLRNVPIGGGCRKSRRGKSIRVSKNGGANSRALAHNPFSYPVSGNIPSTNYIDLAEVYANFLSPKPWVESVSQMPDGVLGQPVEILNLPNFDSHLPQGSDFLDYGDFPGRLLPNMELLGDGNFQKQMQSIVLGSGFMISNMNQMNYNSASLLLPGEDAVISDGILWPGSDLILPNQIHETPGMTAELAGRNSEILNRNVSTFSELNLEAIFRS